MSGSQVVKKEDEEETDIENECGDSNEIIRQVVDYKDRDGINENKKEEISYPAFDWTGATSKMGTPVSLCNVFRRSKWLFISRM